MKQTIKRKIAETFARNHDNFICKMSGRIINCNIERMTENRMKRIDNTINAVIEAGTEKNWTNSGNHEMTICTWREMFEMCNQAKN